MSLPSPEGNVLIRVYLFIGLYVCMLPTFLKNYWTELHEIFRDDLSSSKDQSIRFWERSGQKSSSRSRKGQTLIFVITRSVSSDSYEANAKMFTFQFPIL